MITTFKWNCILILILEDIVANLYVELIKSKIEAKLKILVWVNLIKMHSHYKRKKHQEIQQRSEEH